MPRREPVTLPAYIRPIDREGLDRFGFQLDEPTPYETTGRLPRGWWMHYPAYANYYGINAGKEVERVRIYPNAVYELQSIDLVGSKPPHQQLVLPALVILPRYVIQQRDSFFYVADRATNALAAPCTAWKTPEEVREELNNWFPGSDPDGADYDPTAYWREWDEFHRPARWYNLRRQFRRA